MRPPNKRLREVIAFQDLGFSEDEERLINEVHERMVRRCKSGPDAAFEWIDAITAALDEGMQEIREKMRAEARRRFGVNAHIV